ncbi:multidrug resistance efflux transporter family protein [Bacillus timonensis]|nr:multidrug resistance efflux transporter family protein [Bacillus timonensis]
MVKAMFIGILSSLFFAVTFILNRSMELSGGSWMWSSSLRYFFMVPFLLAIVLLKGNLVGFISEFKRAPLQWLIWSLVGFGLFYGPLTFAAASGPGWLVAGTWPITIIAGSLLAPFFFDIIENQGMKKKVRRRIPIKGLGYSSLILVGIMLIQLQHANGEFSLHLLLVGFLPILIAAIAYPLGNRKTMELCEGRIDTVQRVLGMTLFSLPLWLVIAGVGWWQVGFPSADQTIQTLIVAICSGVIATVLFFFATELVKTDQSKLAAVEATQASQVMFVIIGEMLILHEPFPNSVTTIGLCIVIVGMILHSISSRKKTLDIGRNSKAL